MNRRIGQTVAPGWMLYARFLMNKVSPNVEGVRTKAKRLILHALLKDFQKRIQNWVGCGFLGIMFRGTIGEISPWVSASAGGSPYWYALISHRRACHGGLACRQPKSTVL